METTSNLKHRPIKEKHLNETSVNKQIAVLVPNVKETTHPKSLSKRNTVRLMYEQVNMKVTFSPSPSTRLRGRLGETELNIHR
jgi:hypothetical protein